VIPNGLLPTSVCRVPRGYARRALGIAEGSVLFANVGRVSRHKNQDGLLAAFRDVVAAVPEARLFMAGSGRDSEYGRDLAAKHRDLLESGVARVERFPEGVDVLLSAADAFVSSSFFEGWSLAVSEAAWCGLPLVLTDCGGSLELADVAGEAGHVVPNPAGDPQGVSPSVLAAPDPGTEERSRSALAAAMIETARGRDSHEAGAADRRSRARERLSANAMLEAYARVLRAAADGLASRTPAGLDNA
jgi:glycosyltransferase involved in cell wall biosynthesis